MQIKHCGWIPFFIFIFLSFSQKTFADEGDLESRSQTFDDAREQMLAGHRSEALTILKNIYNLRHDSRSGLLIESYSTQFFTQESESLYCQAVQLIGARKWSEAKDKLEAAATKEPDQGLILLRLVQVYLELGQKELSEEKLKAALKLNPLNKDLRLYQAMIKLVNGEERDGLRNLDAMKSYILSNPLVGSLYLLALKKALRINELYQIKTRIFSDSNLKTSIAYALTFNQILKLNPHDQKTVRAQLDHCGPKGICKELLEREEKKSQYLWLFHGQLRDELLKNLSGART